MSNDTMLYAQCRDHLRNVLVLLADLHPEDKTLGLIRAQQFYDSVSDTKIEPHEGYVSRLIHTTTNEAEMEKILGSSPRT
jgi:hypothetical protein